MTIHILVLFVSLFYVQMDELACFAPGMIALGSLGYDPGESQKFLTLAEEVFWNSIRFVSDVLDLIGNVLTLSFNSCLATSPYFAIAEFIGFG